MSEDTICLVDITPDNWRLEWNVAESQKIYVADSAVLLARAYAYREQGSRAFVIYNDKIPVGMGLYYDCPERNVMIHDNRRLAKRGFYCLSQIFIDQRY